MSAPIEEMHREAARTALDLIDAGGDMPRAKWMLLHLAQLHAAGYARGLREGQEALALILPLAKGYASAHPHGSSRRYIAVAEALLPPGASEAPEEECATCAGYGSIVYEGEETPCPACTAPQEGEGA